LRILPGWLEALARKEAHPAADRIAFGEEAMSELHESFTSDPATKPQR